MLFCVYSPVHAVLWMLWNAGNWIMMAAVMVGVSFQVRIVIQFFLSLPDHILVHPPIFLGTCLNDDL